MYALEAGPLFLFVIFSRFPFKMVVKQVYLKCIFDPCFILLCARFVYCGKCT